MKYLAEDSFEWFDCLWNYFLQNMDEFLRRKEPKTFFVLIVTKKLFDNIFFRSHFKLRAPGVPV